MAKPITVKILGDASDLQRALGQAETRLSKFGGVAKTAALGAAGAVAGIGAVALKVGGDFDQARKDIAVATGASGAALDDLFDQFKDVAATVPGGMDEVAAATGAVATQLGLTGDDLETVVRSASELAEVLGADLGDTADNAARVMNQFGVAATDADGFMGDLLKATQDFGVDLPGLLSDLEKMGPALQSVGFSAEGATAFLGAANKAGVDVTRLKSPLLQFAKAAIEAGKDPAEAFADFAEQASGVTDSVELLALANENFGTTGGAAIAELVEAGVPLGDLNDLLGDNAGLVGDTVEQTRTWTDKLKILKNRALVAVEPLLSKIVDGIDAFVTALGPAFDTIGDAVEAFKSGGLTGLSDFIEARFGPNSPVTRAMRAFTDAWPDIRDTVTDAIRTVRQVVGTVLDALSLAWETWGDNITAVATTVFEQVDDVIGGVIDVLTGLIDFVEAVFTGDWSAAWDAIKQVVKGAWDAVTSLIEVAETTVSEAVKAVIDAVKLLWDWSFLSDWVSTAVDKVTGFFEGLPDKLTSFVADIGDAAGDIGSAIVDGIADGVTGAVGFVGDFTRGLGNALIDFVNTNVIGRINDAIPDKITVPGPIPDINLPDNPLPRIPRLATGGPLRGMALVGERGPELIDLRQGAGTVRSAPDTRNRLAHAATIEQHFHGPQDPDEIAAAVLFALRVSPL